MLIQNAINTVQAPQPEKAITNRLPSNGEPLKHEVEAKTAAPPPSAAQLQSVLNGINKVLQQSNRSLQFSLSDETDMAMVKLVDTDTGEVIRQIPSEETLAIARSIDQFQQGLLLKQTA